MTASSLRLSPLLPSASPPSPSTSLPTVHLIQAKTDIDAVLTWLREYESSPHTFTNYRKEAERLLYWTQDRGKTLGALSRDDLMDYQRFLANPQPAEKWVAPAKPRSHPDWKPFTGPLSASSQRQALTILNTLFKYLREAGYLAANPLALARLGKRRVPASPTIDRNLEPTLWQKVWSSLDTLPNDTPRAARQNARARWLLSLLYLTGARRAEVAQAVMGDIYPRNGMWWWRVVGKGNKVGDIPVGEDLLAALAQYRQHLGLGVLPQLGEQQPLVGRLSAKGQVMPLTDRHICGLVKAVFARTAAQCRATEPAMAAKLEAASTHWLRHTSATHQLDAGVPLLVVSQNLRHSNIQTTRKYLHTEDDVRHAATQALKLRP